MLNYGTMAHSTHTYPRTDAQTHGTGAFLVPYSCSQTYRDRLGARVATTPKGRRPLGR